MSIIELQKQIQSLTDQINDIFHATELNFDAIKIQLQIEDQPTLKPPSQKPIPTHPAPTSQKATVISQCQREFHNLRQAYTQRSNLRLQYLINEQIKSQQEKVRRQRLLQYEDKIYDHRRLICDKESFYDTLIKPKAKRPPGVTNEQFQEMRIKQAQDDDRKNFQQLEEETQILLRLEKVFRTYRLALEEEFHQYQEKSKEGQKEKVKVQKEEVEGQVGDKKQEQQEDRNKQLDLESVPRQVKPPSMQSASKQHLRNRVITLLNTTPTLYSKFQHPHTITPQILQQSKSLLKQCLGISQNELELMKEYKEEREMFKYLKWEQTDLIKKYRKLQGEIEGLRQEGDNKGKIKGGKGNIVKRKLSR